MAVKQELLGSLRLLVAWSALLSGLLGAAECFAQEHEPTATVTVRMTDALRFKPAKVVVHVGDTVQWVWVSGFHSTTSGSSSGSCNPDGIWNSGAGSGMTFSHTFTSAGTFPYFCLVHQSMMQGTVVVQ